jgi:hypothetical protein
MGSQTSLGDLKQLISEIDERAQLSARIEVVQQRSFTGQEIATIVVSFGLGGFAASFFKTLGERAADTLWKKLTELRRELDRDGEKQAELRICITQEHPERRQTLVCTLSSSRELGKLDRLRTEVADAERVDAPTVELREQGWQAVE